MKNLLMLVALTAFLLGNAFGQAPSQRKIEVIGFASKDIPANIAYLSITIKEYQTAKGKRGIDEIEKELQGILLKLKIPAENLTVTNVFGHYDYKPDGKIGAYTNRKTYRLKITDFSKIDQVVSQLNEPSLEGVYLQEFGSTELKKIENEVRVAALTAAKEKAGYLLASMSASLGQVLEIQEIDDAYLPPRPMYNMKANAMMMEADQSSVAAQNIKVEYRIRAVFEIK
jgi:uncharacterized protein